jgi:TonB family protein
MESNDTVFYPDWEHNDSAWIDWLTMPEFSGGEEALIDYIKNHTAYPESAIKDNIEGRVIIRCVIDTNGSTSNISTLRSVRSDLDSEFIRVIQKMPKFKPGSDIARAKKGWYIHNVNVWYMFGINFSMHKNDNEEGIVIHPK